MARIKDSLKLTTSEIDTLLDTESTLRIATVGPDTDINLTPMTYGRAGGKIYIFGRGQKIANLRRNATATVLIDVGSAWRELKGIMLRGTATILETKADEQADPDLADAQLNLGKKHNLVKDGAIVPYSATASGRSRRWIVFTPAKVTTWDNSKLPT